MKKLFSIFCVLATALVLGGCNSPEEQPQDEATVDYDGGVFVLCEGTYGAGNSSLWHYHPERKEVRANVFHGANDARLGDTAQSLYMYNGLLFVVVNLCRRRKVDPELALFNANRKFERRFNAVEAALKEQGVSLASAGVEEMEAAWQVVKRTERA